MPYTSKTSDVYLEHGIAVRLCFFSLAVRTLPQQTLEYSTRPLSLITLLKKQQQARHLFNLQLLGPFPQIHLGFFQLREAGKKHENPVFWALTRHRVYILIQV